MSLLEKLISIIIGALFGQVGKSLDEARDDRAHHDLGVATERANQAQEGLKATKAMAEAQVKADKPADQALKDGSF